MHVFDEAFSRNQVGQKQDHEEIRTGLDTAKIHTLFACAAKQTLSKTRTSVDRAPWCILADQKARRRR